jgi:7,8-dihydropterin-6-yl-methyl-4-(beta-D-ribofuranosyl)aminobenzene 5'-phosphate synthase
MSQRGLATVVSAAGVGLGVRFVRGRRRADTEWSRAAPAMLEGLGSVSELTIVPLVDAKASDGLRAEHGVSYLVVADGLRILFDLGLGAGRTASFAHNACALDVGLNSIDLVVLSHAHPDHTGGPRAAVRRSFEIADSELNVRGVEVLTPVPMRHRYARCVRTDEARVIAPGVATTGTIPRMLFFLGWTPEQALMVNVRNKGVVVIVGCGHQGMERLLIRVEAQVRAPIHAVVGGLHLPVHGLHAQDIIGTAKWPWQHTTEHDVDDAIDSLKRRRPHLVAVSPHDSSAWTLDRIAAAFPDSYRRICVGEELHICAEGPSALSCPDVGARWSTHVG